MLKSTWPRPKTQHLQMNDRNTSSGVAPTTPRKVVPSTGPNYQPNLITPSKTNKKGISTPGSMKKTPSKRQNDENKPNGTGKKPKATPGKLPFDSKAMKIETNKNNDSTITSIPSTTASVTNINTGNVSSPMNFIPRDRLNEETVLSPFVQVVNKAAAVISSHHHPLSTSQPNESVKPEEIKELVAEALDIMYNSHEIDEKTYKRMSTAHFSQSSLRRLSMTIPSSKPMHSMEEDSTLGSSIHQNMTSPNRYSDSETIIRKPDVLLALRNYINVLDTETLPLFSSRSSSIVVDVDRNDDGEGEEDRMGSRMVSEESMALVTNLMDKLDEHEMNDSITTIMMIPTIAPEFNQVSEQSVPEQTEITEESSNTTVTVTVHDTNPDSNTSLLFNRRSGSLNRASLSSNNGKGGRLTQYPMQGVFSTALVQNRVIATIHEWVVLQDHVKYQLFIELLPNPSDSIETQSCAQLMLLRRYSDFEKLYVTLFNQISLLPYPMQRQVIGLLPYFPGKQWFSNYSFCWSRPSFLNERLHGLQQWISAILCHHKDIIDILHSIDHHSADENNKKEEGTSETERLVLESSDQTNTIVASAESIYEMALKEFLFN